MRFQLFARLGFAVVLAATGVAGATDMTLQQVTFPERNQIEVPFARDSKAPEATLTADVDFREGQASASLKYRDMKPAILFGGDVTCYVLWAVTPDGTADNLGEALGAERERFRGFFDRAEVVCDDGDRRVQSSGVGAV